jgi:platelet-activating factor acetylhydrolase
MYCFIRGSPLFATKLPAYTGSYEVGTIDLEIPLRRPRLVSNTQFKDKKGPAFQLETVLFSLYYPAIKGAKSPRRHPWIPEPLSLRAQGYAKVAHLNNFITRPILRFGLWIVAGGIMIPAKVDVPILGTEDEKNHDAYPVMVFSHGNLASRTDYTGLCGELASRGHIVAALEHRDGSGPGTVIKHKDRQDRKLLPFAEKDLLSDPPMDTAKLKAEQLAFREAEIEETVAILGRISSGRGPDVFEQNLRNEGHCLHNWGGRIDMDHLVIGGHSYGATGALQALKAGRNSTSIPAVGGIALDPGKGSGPLNEKIDVPLLVVHSNSWSAKYTLFNGRPHFDTVKDLVQGVLSRCELVLH